jgi:deazaflavin-dependent oxidoreductase (nitroreductase family)
MAHTGAAGKAILPSRRQLPWWKRLQERSTSTRFGAWFAIHIATRIDRPLLRWSKGRLALFTPWPIGLLETIGARSGRRRTIPLLCVVEDARIVVVASNGGGPEHPAWYHNVRANPEVAFTIRGAKRAYTAREVDGPERDELWQRMTDLYVGYHKYQERAGNRSIPVIVLDERADLPT